MTCSKGNSAVSVAMVRQIMAGISFCMPFCLDIWLLCRDAWLYYVFIAVLLASCLCCCALSCMPGAFWPESAALMLQEMNRQTHLCTSTMMSIARLCTWAKLLGISRSPNLACVLQSSLRTCNSQVQHHAQRLLTLHSQNACFP